MASQIKSIKKVGNLAQTIAQDDFHRHGFITYESMRAGYDFVAILLDTRQRIVQHMFVEVKKTTTAGNARAVSKIQQNFKKICKITHVDHLTYYVTDDQMDYWLQTKKTITLDQFIDSEDGVI